MILKNTCAGAEIIKALVDGGLVHAERVSGSSGSVLAWSSFAEEQLAAIVASYEAAARDAAEAKVRRLTLELGRLRELVSKWRDMSDDEMRRRCGEMAADEIRSVRAVLRSILPEREQPC